MKSNNASNSFGLTEATRNVERALSDVAEIQRLNSQTKKMKRVLIFLAIAAVTWIVLTMLFGTEPPPATPLGLADKPRRLTPAEQRDSVTPGRRAAKG